MPNYAVIQNNVVTNVIVAETLDIAELVTSSTCVDITDLRVGIGWGYVDGEFTAPIILTEGEPVNPVVPVLED